MFVYKRWVAPSIVNKNIEMEASERTDHKPGPSEAKLDIIT